MLSVIGVMLISLLALGLVHRLYRVVAVEWRYVQRRKNALKRRRKNALKRIWPLAAGYLLAHAVAFGLLLPCLGVRLFDLIVANLVFVMAGPPSIAMFLFLAWTAFVESREGTIARRRYRSETAQFLYRVWKAMLGMSYVSMLGFGLYRVLTSLIVLEHVALIGFTGTVCLIWFAVPKARYVLSRRACRTGRLLQRLVRQPVKTRVAAI